MVVFDSADVSGTIAVVFWFVSAEDVLSCVVPKNKNMPPKSQLLRRFLFP